MKRIKLVILSLMCCAIFLVPSNAFSQIYNYSPHHQIVIPEVIYASATGGGSWVSDVMITIRNTGGTNVLVWFEYDGGLRGPFTIITGASAYHSYKIYNILYFLGAWYDTGFNYFNRVGALYLTTNNPDERIWASCRTKTGNYSKTLPGVPRNVDANTAAVGRHMMIHNLSNTSTYRSTVGFWNESGSSLTVTFVLINSGNGLIGSSWQRTIGGLGYYATDPFLTAGAGAGYYENCWLYVVPSSGSGKIMCFGATSNNFTNDPSAHLAYPFNY